MCGVRPWTLENSLTQSLYASAEVGDAVPEQWGDTLIHCSQHYEKTHPVAGSHRVPLNRPYTTATPWHSPSEKEGGWHLSAIPSCLPLLLS